MSLSSLVVKREVATMRQVEEALARQVIYGGDLVTNLLEVARIDEDALTQLIAESMHLPPAPSGELPLLPENARHLPSGTAVAQGAVPLALEGEVLVLAVAERLSPDVEERLMFAAGLAIEQRASTAVRVHEAIARLYGVPLERRMQRLVARLGGGSLPDAAVPTPPLGSVTPGAPEPSMLTSRKAPSDFAGSHNAPVSRASAGAPVSLESPPPPTLIAAQRRAGLLKRDMREMPSMARTVRRRGPIILETAKREAHEASDKDALLDLFFDFSRQFFDYSALFLMHGDIAEGRDAFGGGASRDRVVGIGVPLDLPSLMSRARDERAPVVSKAPIDGLDRVLLADLQRPLDAEMAVVPLIVRTRAVAMLLGDCGDAGIEHSGIAAITALAAVVGQGLERIIMRRKLEGFVVGRTSDPGIVPEASDGVAHPSPAPDSSRRPVARLIPTSTMPPPPANIANIRAISGPPIPREEPESPRRAHPMGAVNLETEVPRHLDSRALFDLLGWETGKEEPEVAPPSSAVAVPPHRPPHGHRTHSQELPSVIVDLEQELGEIIDRIVSGTADESAEAELLRQGERAMRVLMTRFPGPVTFDRARLATAKNPPRASECGTLLRLVARERKVALPFVLERLSDPDPEARGWATHLLGELPYDEAIPYLLMRLRDSDPITRASAAQALSSVAKVFPDQARDAIRALAESEDPVARAAALSAMARLRIAGLVPDFIHALADLDEQVVIAAHDALIEMTWQDFGNDARPWLKWWEHNASRHRVEWLIDSLTHEVSEIRRGAGEELRLVTREYFGYASDLPSRERDRAQQRYRDWWITEGRNKFRRR
jgi:hypothetical protein